MGSDLPAQARKEVGHVSLKKKNNVFLFSQFHSQLLSSRRANSGLYWNTSSPNNYPVLAETGNNTMKNHYPQFPAGETEA